MVIRILSETSRWIISVISVTINRVAENEATHSPSSSIVVFVVCKINGDIVLHNELCRIPEYIFCSAK